METKIELPNIIFERMKKHPAIDWASLIKRELILKISERDIVEEIVKKSNLKEKDAEEISSKIKKSLHKVYNNAYSQRH